jgi:serine/threonine-protein kinase
MQNYELGEIIESGGMGAVYKGRHTALERDVAIKFILPHVAGDEAAVERFLREARLAARINHPNVVHVYDTGVDQQGQPYIVMELLTGESLKERLARGPMTEADAVDIGKQVLMALEKAHSMEVVHRDIKPANIYLCTDRTVKILDFGVAKGLDAGSTGNVTVAGKTVGSPAYMSPEQAEGIPVDSRTDIYSVGIVMYEILTGYTPFRGENSLAIMQKHLNTPPPPLPKEANSAVRSVIEKALAKKPDKRFASAHEMKLALDKVSAKNVVVAKSETGESAANPTPSPGRKSTKSHETATAERKSPVLAIVIAVAALVTIGVGAMVVPKVLGGGSSSGSDPGPVNTGSVSVPDPDPQPSATPAGTDSSATTDSSVATPFEKRDAIEEPIPFETTYEDDPNLDKGQEVTKVEGVDGKKVVTYLITYDKEGGTEIDRKQEGEPAVILEPIAKVVSRGTKAVATGFSGVKSETKTVSIPFRTTYTNSSAIRKGKTQTTRRGRTGQREITYQVTYENGKVINKREAGSRIVREPVNAEVTRGTGSSGSGSGDPPKRGWRCRTCRKSLSSSQNFCPDDGTRKP